MDEVEEEGKEEGSEDLHFTFRIVEKMGQGLVTTLRFKLIRTDEMRD